MAQEELFLEQMVRRGTDKEVLIKRILLVISALVICVLPYAISLTAGYLAGPVIMIAAALAVWILWRRAYREYEYIFTDGTLDIDIIFNRSSRKHVASFDVKQARLIAPSDDEKNKALIEGKYEKTIYAGAGEITPSTYVLLGQLGDKTCKLYFDPTEELLKAIKHSAPRITLVRS